MSTVTSYTADVSICSQICRLAIQECGLTSAKNVEVDIEHAMDNYEPWFVRLQPKMTVPVMDYDGELVQDSKDILYFLAKKHPEAGLYPEEARLQIDEFVGRFYENFMFVGIFTFGHLQSRSEDLRDFINVGKTEISIKKLRALAENAEFVEVAQPKLAEVEQRDMSRLANPKLLGRADEGVQAMLSGLEALLGDDRVFVCGASYTLADVVATALLARVHMINGLEWFTPKITDYWQTVVARPSFETANICATWESTLMSQQFEAYLAQRSSCG